MASSPDQRTSAEHFGFPVPELSEGPGVRGLLVWRFDEPLRAIATTVLGGGLGTRSWALNVEVDLGYDEPDPASHLSSVAADLGLEAAGGGGRGIGFLTAARVADVSTFEDEGARCDATVGISVPTWAAGPEGSWSEWAPGTINLMCWVPAPMSDAALVNLVATATEAKVQAMLDAGVPGTGTASDAIAVCCPDGGTEAYGGPRSEWGSRLARAVHGAVAAGTARFLAGGLADPS